MIRRISQEHLIMVISLLPRLLGRVTSSFILARYLDANYVTFDNDYERMQQFHDTLNFPQTKIAWFATPVVFV